MHEMWERAETDVPGWLDVFDGQTNRIHELLAGWSAAVDWPVSAVWQEVAAAYPDALVVLSHRGSAAKWWASADATVWEAMRRWGHDGDPLLAGWNERLRAQGGFSSDLDDADGAMERYDQHFAEVVEAIPSERLLLWQPGDGWEPICERLGVAVPDDEPVHVNSTAEFRRREKFDEAT